MLQSSCQMEVNGLIVRVHHPKKGLSSGTRLAPSCEWPVHRVCDYDDGQLPENWERGDANQASYFMGVESDRELWFDFNGNADHTHDVAVIVSIQGMNALTGKPIDVTRLEQYQTACPIHEELFGEGRFCKACGHTWPHQNYLSGSAQGNHFWIDGWRAFDGNIRQFVFDLMENGTGVAQQILGQKRARGIGFAFYLSKLPKPIQSKPLYRGGSVKLAMVSESEMADDHGDGFLSLCADENDLGLETFGDSHADEKAYRGLVNGGLLSATPAKRLLTTEVSFDREVDQTFNRDPNELDYWQQTPAGLIVLSHTDNESVFQITRNGPTVDRTAGGMGPLAGLKGVGK